MICGAPFDGGTTYRAGARFGPKGVRNASALTRGFHPAQGLDLFEHLRCADGGDVACIPMSVDRTLASITARTEQIIAGGALPVFVGGDHTISLGPLRALAEKHGPLGLIHFDAHSDTFGPAWDIDLHHGTVFRKAIEEGLLRPRDVMQIGIRGPFTAANDLDYARKAGLRIVMMDEIRNDLGAVAREIQARAGTGKYYVSFDMDGLDPAYAPGTGTPVPGGMNSYEALALTRALVGLDVVGIDIVEISPDHDPSGNTTLLAATLLTEMLASVAATRIAGAGARVRRATKRRTATPRPRTSTRRPKPRPKK
ncbi:MAG: agmatinase [Sandaracinaceae bacterium]|nr:agmatinase [Sandaracinaceae bacterium]